MIRYVRERNDNCSCGPIAIINAMKWSGEASTLRSHFRRVCQASRCKPSIRGAPRGHFDRTMHQLCPNINIKKRVFPTIQSIYEHLQKSDSAVVVTISWIETGDHVGRMVKSHYALLVRTTASGKSFVGINYCRGKTQSLIRRTTLIYHCRRRRNFLGDWYPVAWFLTKKQKQ